MLSHSIANTGRPASRSRNDVNAQGGWRSREEAIMGTSVRVELWCDNRITGDQTIDAVMDEMHRIDHAMSPHKAASELSQINRNAFAKPVVLSEEMFQLIARAIEFSKLSDGAFDITYASVGQLYDYRQGIRPSDEELTRACAFVGHQHLMLDTQARTLRFACEGARIDLGGFAKGHAVDRGAAILKSRGIRHGIVTAGGDSRIVGDRRGRPWMIGIRDPRKAGEIAAMLPLSDVAMSTSGDYERYFEKDGVRCHHVLDPRTGKSPDTIQSVTILADDGLTTEALSKSMFVLGLERGMRLIESQPGVDAVVVDAHRVLHYSAGLGAGLPQTPP